MKLPATIKPDDMRNLVEHFPQLLRFLRVEDTILDIADKYNEDGIGGIANV
ncbi:MAG: hypothetical protein ACFFEV_07550 [Candidatus Thorarchaeota archaeon]